MMTAECKRRAMIHDFLTARKGLVLTAIRASQLIDEFWGIKVDWHDMSDALQYMELWGGAMPAGMTADRMVEYIIN